MATKIMATLGWLVLMFILAAVLYAIMAVIFVWSLYMMTPCADHRGHKRLRMAGMESGDKESGQDSSAAATASSAKKKKKKKSKAYFGKK